MRYIFKFSLFGLCWIFFMVNVFWIMRRISQPNAYIVAFNTNQPVIHVTSTMYLSVALDSSHLRNFSVSPIHDEKFLNLAHHLSPAYLRIGGTSADCLYFNQTNFAQLPDEKKNSVDSGDLSNFTLTDRDFLYLYEFTKKAGLRMIFDLNALMRNVNGRWDDSNAKEIIVFAKSHGMELDWQLGNEPNSYRHVFDVDISAEQLGKDYCSLRSLLNAFGYEESLLVGPEANRVEGGSLFGSNGEQYIKQFLESAGGCIDFITWHQYYLNGHNAIFEDFLNTSTFNYLPSQIKEMAETIKTTGKEISMWLSETSTAYGGGAPGLSDRFVAGFLWLDKLGFSASAGLKVIIRHALYGGYYSLIGADLNPNPDWWISVIFKKLVSEKVLKLIAPDNFGTLRMYAHCTATGGLTDRNSGITIYGVNLDKRSTAITIPKINNDDTKIHLYILTSDDLKSRNIKLNGETLRLQPNGSLPNLTPVKVDPNDVINIPAYSMVFIVVPAKYLEICKE